MTKIVLVAQIVDPKDSNGIIVDIGGTHVPLTQATLEQAATMDGALVADVEATIAQTIARRETAAADKQAKSDAETLARKAALRGEIPPQA